MPHRGYRALAGDEGQQKKTPLQERLEPSTHAEIVPNTVKAAVASSAKQDSLRETLLGKGGSASEKPLLANSWFNWWLPTPLRGSKKNLMQAEEYKHLGGGVG